MRDDSMDYTQLLALAPGIAVIGGYLYAGDVDSMIALVTDHPKETLEILQIIGLFAAGLLRMYRIGAGLMVTLIITVVWGA